MIEYKHHSVVHILAAKWRIVLEENVRLLHLPSSLLMCYKEGEEGKCEKVQLACNDKHSCYLVEGLLFISLKKSLSFALYNSSAFHSMVLYKIVNALLCPSRLHSCHRAHSTCLNAHTYVCTVCALDVSLHWMSRAPYECNIRGAGHMYNEQCCLRACVCLVHMLYVLRAPADITKVSALLILF